MKKGILIAVLALSVLLFGCSTISNVTGLSPSTSTKILRKAELTSKWEMMHLSLELGAGDQLPVLLKLADGDKVDGYFYLEKGNNVDFQITANSLIYRSAQDTTATRGTTSDRFAFTASTAQGSSYTLTFRNNASGKENQTRVTVFLEVIYPASGSLFTPLENK